MAKKIDRIHFIFTEGDKTFFIVELLTKCDASADQLNLTDKALTEEMLKVFSQIADNLESAKIEIGEVHIVKGTLSPRQRKPRLALTFELNVPTLGLDILRQKYPQPEVFTIQNLQPYIPF